MSIFVHDILVADNIGFNSPLFINVGGNLRLIFSDLKAPDDPSPTAPDRNTH